MINKLRVMQQNSAPAHTRCQEDVGPPFSGYGTLAGAENGQQEPPPRLRGSDRPEWRCGALVFLGGARPEKVFCYAAGPLQPLAAGIHVQGVSPVEPHQSYSRFGREVDGKA